MVVNITNSDEYQRFIRYCTCMNATYIFHDKTKCCLCFSSSNPTVALFSADWAEQCKQVLTVFEELSKHSEYKSLQFINVPAEDLSEISMKHQIEAVPTIIFFKNSTATDRIDGINIAALSTKCKALAGVHESSKEQLNERLKKLTNKANLMIFMKGDRNTPRCGFSKQLIAILNDTG